MAWAGSATLVQELMTLLWLGIRQLQSSRNCLQEACCAMLRQQASHSLQWQLSWLRLKKTVLQLQARAFRARVAC